MHAYMCKYLYAGLIMLHDVALQELFEQIRPLLLPPPDPPRNPIGFSVNERRGVYRVRRRKGQ